MAWLSLSWPSWMRLPAAATARHLLYGVLIGVSLSMSSTTFALYYRARRRERLTAKFHLRPIELRSDEILSGVTGLIGEPSCPRLGLKRSILTISILGNTPLVRINSLSDALGVEILGKAEVSIPYPYMRTSGR